MNIREADLLAEFLEREVPRAQFVETFMSFEETERWAIYAALMQKHAPRELQELAKRVQADFERRKH